MMFKMCIITWWNNNLQHSTKNYATCSIIQVAFSFQEFLNPQGLFSNTVLSRLGNHPI